LVQAVIPRMIIANVNDLRLFILQGLNIFNSNPE